MERVRPDLVLVNPASRKRMYQSLGEDLSAVEPPVWEYGYGAVDEAAGRVSFTPFQHFADGTWRAAETIPDPETNYLSLGAGGGHPGSSTAQSTVRRWIAPRDGVVGLDGTLNHAAEEGKGDGVVGYVVSSRSGIAWSAPAKSAKVETNVARIDVTKGDTIDFVVSPGPTDSFDSFGWAPVVRYSDDLAQNAKNEWRADVDFAGPPPPAMNPWERLAQVLLASNEFAFVD